MDDTDRFTEREKRMIYNSVKPHRFDSDEYYELYEKVSEWYFNSDTDREDAFGGNA